MPSTWVWIDEIIVVHVGRHVGRGRGRIAAASYGSENEVDDDVSSDVDRNPGYCVLTRESGGDFAEVFGTCYDLQTPMSACHEHDYKISKIRFLCVDCRRDIHGIR